MPLSAASHKDSSKDPSKTKDFFLPDLCQAQSILFLVLVAELLVLVMVLASSSLLNFNWVRLGLTSLFTQWVVLSSATILCNCRPWLMGMSITHATLAGYAIIMLVTLVFSVLGEWVLLLPGETWGGDQWGDIGRNLLVAAVMAGIAFRYFYLQYQLRRQEQAELNSRIQALQSRIRPHFLFNSMNIIASLISVDPETAERVVEDLSLLFRASLNQSTDMPVPLAEELELCEKYVHIESLRLDDRLRVKWDVQVDTKTVRIPLLTLQPLLENAIYHGIQPLPGGGEVMVSIVQQGRRLVASVTNPVAESQVTETRTSVQGNRMALENIRHRLEAIYGAEASLESTKSRTSFNTVISYPIVEASR